MTSQQKAFLDVLRAALRGEACPQAEEKEQLLKLAGTNGVIPLVANALYPSGEEKNAYTAHARELAVGQAQRTAEFLLLMKRLEEQGLRPVVVKGIVCRSLYPEPELRYSADEDLLIRPEEFELYVSALKTEGYDPADGQIEQSGAYEYKFHGRDSGLLIELHTSLFPAGSEAYGDCSRFFENAVEHTMKLEIEGLGIRTLTPTDHVLYLMCHAYKHLLHSGIGIRQVCDLAMTSEKFRGEIDWSYIRQACDQLQITVLCSALYRIGEKHLGFFMPEAFMAQAADEQPLLEDILSGGRFEQDDLDRAHSSTLTLEAVSAERSGSRRKGALHSVFLPLESMRRKYPYLRENPWLLPAAWGQRIFSYLTRKDRPDSVNPARSVQIARERIELLRMYQIIR